MSLLDGGLGAAPPSGHDDFELVAQQTPPSGTSSRVWQVGLLIVLVAGLIGYFLWHTMRNTGESVARIRHYPARYDGRTVMLRGRVGEAFAMGGSWAYYLHQGRDTIVVFSRLRTPIKNSNIAVYGSISMGYLDGQPRPALFESAPPP